VFGTFVVEGKEIEVEEQLFARAEQDRSNCEVHLVDKLGFEIGPYFLDPPVFAIVRRENVSSRVESPIRAAACAASQPAWPAPTTTTS